jgi:magnesium transporter
MTKSLRGIGVRKGLPPGTIVRMHGAAPTEYALIRWNEGRWERMEGVPDSPGEGWSVRWSRATGFGDTDALASLGGAFGMNALQVEDALNTHDRPKAEIDDDSVFITIQSIFPGSSNGEVTRHLHLALYLRDGRLLSFEEGAAPLFDSVEERIARDSSRLRRQGADYLLYVLMDVVVDGYFATLESLAERIEALEDEVLGGSGSNVLQRIQDLRREMLMFRRAVWPLREVVGNLSRFGGGPFTDFTKPFLRDLYDHSVMVLETTETLREMLTGLLEIHLSTASNRMNEIMRVLTIIATIFMPLTFIAGIYGMNFEHMPELPEPLCYPGVLLLMLLIGGGMTLFFRRRGWL